MKKLYAIGYVAGFFLAALALLFLSAAAARLGWWLAGKVLGS